MSSSSWHLAPGDSSKTGGSRLRGTRGVFRGCFLGVPEALKKEDYPDVICLNYIESQNVFAFNRPGRFCFLSVPVGIQKVSRGDHHSTKKKVFGYSSLKQYVTPTFHILDMFVVPTTYVKKYPVPFALLYVCEILDDPASSPALVQSLNLAPLSYCLSS